VGTADVTGAVALARRIRARSRVSRARCRPRLLAPDGDRGTIVFADASEGNHPCAAAMIVLGVIGLIGLDDATSA